MKTLRLKDLGIKARNKKTHKGLFPYGPVMEVLFNFKKKIKNKKGQNPELPFAISVKQLKAPHSSPTKTSSKTIELLGLKREV